VLRLPGVGSGHLFSFVRRTGEAVRRTQKKMNIGDRIELHVTSKSLEKKRAKRARLTDDIVELERRRAHVLTGIWKRFPFVWQVVQKSPDCITWSKVGPPFTTEPLAQKQMAQEIAKQGGDWVFSVEKLPSHEELGVDNVWMLDLENVQDIFPHVWN
jgi:hypothetical protein